MILDENGIPYKCQDKETCEHNGAVVTFDHEAAKGLDTYEIRKRWPRFFGTCPDCGCQLIKYHSKAHYVYGDW